jgi:hypothetical protein
MSDVSTEIDDRAIFSISSLARPVALRPAVSINALRSDRNADMAQFLQPRRTLTCLLASFSFAHAGEHVHPAGLGYCAPPYPPECIEDDSTYKDERHADDCKINIAHFLASAAAYRLCLQREIARAIFDANAAVDRFKCRTAPPSHCQ